MDLMSNLFNRGGGSSPAAGLVERATSELLIGPDWGANMELVDMVMNDTLGEGVHALDAIKRRIASGAPKSQGLALECLETLIKNCGEGFHRLPAHKGVLVEMGKLVTGRSIGQPLEVTNVAVKARDLIDEWAEAIVYAPAFREEYAALKARGVHFPPKDISRLDPDFIPGESPMYTGPASAAAAIHEADRAAIERAIAEADAEAAGLGGGGGSAAGRLQPAAPRKCTAHLELHPRASKGCHYALGVIVVPIGPPCPRETGSLRSTAKLARTPCMREVLRPREMQILM